MSENCERERNEVALLGGFRLTVGGGDVCLPESAQRLVAALALRGHSGRSRLAGGLWPDAEEHRALARLRTTIWRVNQAAPGLLLLHGPTVALRDGVAVDVDRLVDASRAVSRGGDVTGWATERPDGDLLPDWDDEWLVDERERLHQLRLHTLESAADRLAAEGRFGLAVDVALTVLRGDPMRESAYRTLMRVHLAEGNYCEAQRTFRRCEQVLWHELGVTPQQATHELVRPA